MILCLTVQSTKSIRAHINSTSFLVCFMCLRTLRTLLWSVLNWWILNTLNYWGSLAFLRLSGMLCLCSVEMGNISFSLYEILAVSPLITISLTIIWQNMLIIEIALLMCTAARILLELRACATRRTQTVPWMLCSCLILLISLSRTEDWPGCFSLGVLHDWVSMQIFISPVSAYCSTYTLVKSGDGFLGF